MTFASSVSDDNFDRKIIFPIQCTSKHHKNIDNVPHEWWKISDSQIGLALKSLRQNTVIFRYEQHVQV